MIQLRNHGCPSGTVAGSMRRSAGGHVIRTIGMSSWFTPSNVVMRSHTASAVAGTTDATSNDRSDPPTCAEPYVGRRIAVKPIVEL